MQSSRSDRGSPGWERQPAIYDSSEASAATATQVSSAPGTSHCGRELRPQGLITSPGAARESDPGLICFRRESLASPSSASLDAGAAIGRTVLYAVNFGALTGGWLADMNKTHIYNPRWTPHAKFHDGITISAASLAGGAGLYFLARRPFGQPADTTIAALLPAIIFGSQAFAFLFPGAEGLEAEAPEMVPQLGKVRVNELPAALAGVALAGLGYLLTRRKRKL